MSENTGKPALNAVKSGSSGPVLVMLHGWGQSLESLRLLGDLLSRFYRVHLIDLPGFGQSEAPPAAWDTSQYADLIHQYIADNKLSPALVLGHSFGGRVAIRLASRHKDSVASLILINSGGLRVRPSGLKRWRSLFVRSLARICKFLDRSCGWRTFESWFVPRFASADYKAAGPMRDILVKAVNEDVSEDASRIACPTFLLWGENDSETPLEIGKRLNNLIAGSRLVVLPGCGHFPFLDEGAHLCAYHILKYLEAPQSKSKPAKAGAAAGE